MTSELPAERHKELSQLCCQQTKPVMTDNYKVFVEKQDKTADTYSQQKGITLKREVVSLKSNLDGTLRPADTYNQQTNQSVEQERRDELKDGIIIAYVPPKLKTADIHTQQDEICRKVNSLSDIGVRTPADIHSQETKAVNLTKPLKVTDGDETCRTNKSKSPPSVPFEPVKDELCKNYDLRRYKCRYCNGNGRVKLFDYGEGFCREYKI